jgi:hypothetical protein
VSEILTDYFTNTQVQTVLLVGLVITLLLKCGVGGWRPSSRKKTAEWEIKMSKNRHQSLNLVFEIPTDHFVNHQVQAVSLVGLLIHSDKEWRSGWRPATKYSLQEITLNRHRASI